MSDKLTNTRLNIKRNLQGTNDVHNVRQSVQQHELIYGTNLDVQTEKRAMLDFLNLPINNQHLRTSDILRENVTKNVQELSFDMELMQIHSKTLFMKFVSQPSDMVGIFDDVCSEWAVANIPEQNEQLKIKSFPSHMPEQFRLRIRDIGVKNITNMVCIRGLVLRVSEIVPLMVSGKFECSICHDHFLSVLTDGVIKEERFCEKCRNLNTQGIKHNSSLFKDTQQIKIQENPEDLPQGETAQNVLVHVTTENVDKVKPGDRVELIGIYVVDSKRVNESKTVQKTLMKNQIAVLSFTNIERSKDSIVRQLNPDEGLFSEDRIQEFRVFSQRSDCMEQLIKGFAPSIYESEQVKFGLLTQLFGGVEKNMQRDSHSSTFSKRGEINILLLGDPSTGKSQLLKQVNSVANRGIYTSGKGSSAVGLTAHVAKDPETGELVLESGALVLSDRGICCIDEFDKMSESGRSVLHEVMEQQTISIAKAGIICNLNARTAILAAANPIESRYNPRLSVVKNINLPPSLISRFDLIFIILDDINEEKDRLMGEHILNMFSDITFEENNDCIDKDFLKEYIAQARQVCKPRINDESQEILLSQYLEMRRYGNVHKTISATPRQLESLIRIAESIAKMRLSEVVTGDDVTKAYELFQNATKQSMTDPTTGLIDMNLVSGGMSNEDLMLLDQVREALLQYFEKHKVVMREGISYKTTIDDLVKDFKESRGVVVQVRVVTRALDNLEEDNKIMMGGAHSNRFIKLIE